MSNKWHTKHHYCPEFYLKWFVNKNWKFFVYDKKLKKIIWEKLPSEYFYEKNLYSIDTPIWLDKTIETGFFSKLETDWAPVIKKLRNLNAVDDFQFDKTEDIVTFFQFLSFQFTRTPLFEAVVGKKIKDCKISNFLERYKRSYVLNETFFKKRFTFFIIKEWLDCEFLLSDAPFFSCRLDDWTLIPEMIAISSNILCAIETESVWKMQFQKQELIDIKMVKIINWFIFDNSKNYLSFQNKNSFKKCLDRNV